MNDVSPNVGSVADALRDDSASAGTRVFKGNLFRVRDGRAWTFTEEPPPPPPPQVRRPARVARVLARAHHLEAAIGVGEYTDRADAARRLGFTRARITQILNLVHLAPDIQEDILALEAVDGVQPLSERALRTVVRAADWTAQRAVWEEFGRPGSDQAPSASSK